MVKQAIEEKRSTWSLGEVYGYVSEQLEGTAFAASASGIKASYENVARAVKKGDVHRFYRSTAFRYYDFLLKVSDPVRVIA